MLSQLVKSQGKGQGGTKSFVPLKTVPDKASQPAQRTHLENLWSVNVATTRYQPKLVKLVDEGSVILSLIYACTHTGVQTKCGYCTAYIQKCHFVWSFHLGQFSLPTSGWPLVLQFSLPTSGWPLVLQFSLPTSGWPLVLQFSLLPRCSHLLHPPHSSSCKTLLLWTSHSSCGRPNFLAFFCAYFICCQNASSSGRSLLVQFSGGTYCDKSVQSIHTCHHYWPSGLLCAQRSMPDVLISCLHCRSLSCLDNQWIIAFVFPKDGDRPLVQEIWAGLGVVCLWPRVK